VLDLFRERFRWLLLHDPRFPGIEQLFRSLNVLLDSDVTLAFRVSKNSFRLMEVYKPEPRQALIQNMTGLWQTGIPDIQPTSSPILSARRTNAHKSTLKAVMVVRTVLNILEHKF
jgi:hypothetical protein